MNSETWVLFVVLSLGPSVATHGELAGVYQNDRECVRAGDIWLQNAYNWVFRHQLTFGPMYACFKVRRKPQEKLVGEG